MEQANNKITIAELINDERFKSLIHSQIFAHTTRPVLKEGLRYKRTGMDELIDMTRGGNTDTIIALWVDVINKRSNLSKRLRYTLNIMFSRCISLYFDKYIKKEDGTKDS